VAWVQDEAGKIIKRVRIEGNKAEGFRRCLNGERGAPLRGAFGLERSGEKGSRRWLRLFNRPSQLQNQSHFTAIRVSDIGVEVVA
jgi:hypothetical protein